MRILLIEDDKNLCDTLKYQLEQEGILVDACTDGLDGLHYMKEDAHTWCFWTDASHHERPAGTEAGQGSADKNTGHHDHRSGRAL